MEELTGWGGGDAEVGGDKMSVSNKQSFLCINIYIRRCQDEPGQILFRLGEICLVGQRM